MKKPLLQLNTMLDVTTFANMMFDYIMRPDAGSVRQRKNVSYDEDDFDYSLGYLVYHLQFDFKRLN